MKERLLFALINALSETDKGRHGEWPADFQEPSQHAWLGHSLLPDLTHLGFKVQFIAEHFWRRAGLWMAD